MHDGLRRRLVMIDQRGAVAVEYGILLALIAATLFVVVGVFGQAVKATFDAFLETLP